MKRIYDILGAIPAQQYLFACSLNMNWSFIFSSSFLYFIFLFVERRKLSLTDTVEKSPCI